MPKVSVIVPVYGVEDFIEQCVVSLFEQTMGDMELIFIDDCTPDHSFDIIHEKLEEYRPRLLEKRNVVRIERMPQNSGLAAVRKYGISLAQGEYIITCDSDDWVEPSMYETLYNIAIKERAELVVCDHFVNSSNLSEEVIHKNISDTSNHALLERAISTWTLNTIWCTLAHRALYQKILFPTASQSEDKIFMAQLCFYSKKTVFINQPLYHYRVRGDSISHSVSTKNVRKRFEQASSNWKVMKLFLEKEHLLPSLDLAFEAYTFRIKQFLRRGLGDASFRRMWKSFYPDLGLGILFNPYLTNKERLKGIKSFIRVYFNF